MSADNGTGQNPNGPGTATSGSGEEQAAKTEAAEHVVERAEGWDPGAEPSTVASNLQEGFAEAGVDVDPDEVERIAQDVHEQKDTDVDPGAVS